ncbi:MAG: CT583 family protein [Verrucomicrobia bacterium]|nr:CT583 family protein [Verrucomicrobiota bacterium]
MKDLDSFLTERLQKKNQTHVETLADRKEIASPPLLRSFGLIPLDAKEESALYEILLHNHKDEDSIDEDLASLKRITEEVKAIDTQAILLHGERIKKAQTLLKKYKEGAFTAWLLETYKNRQTPYNFLQYYEFYQSLTQSLREKVSQMPKQAVYTLAARSGELSSKRAIVESSYQEPKEIILQKIRSTFPLSQKDARAQNKEASIASLLNKAISLCKDTDLSSKEKKNLLSLALKLQVLLK